MMNFVVLANNTDSFTLDGIIIDFFNNLGSWGNFALVIISLLLSIVLGGCIGYQREVSGHAAGLRTHVLFSLGCCLLTVISIYGGLNSIGGNFDKSRITAGIVSGAGFLGAGTIIHNGVSVKGLTTATTLWMSMAIGVACGNGWFIIATIATLLALLVLSLLVKLENFAVRKSINMMIIVKRETDAITKILELGDQANLTIKDLDVTLGKYDETRILRITFAIATDDKKRIEEFINLLKIEINPLNIEKI